VNRENYAVSVQDQTAGGMCDSSEDAGYDGTAYWLRVTSGLQRGNCTHSRREAFARQASVHRRICYQSMTTCHHLDETIAHRARH
jgi:hypothetical protein